MMMPNYIRDEDLPVKWWADVRVLAIVGYRNPASVAEICALDEIETRYVLFES
jgi:hypothetical protein